MLAALFLILVGTGPAEGECFHCVDVINIECHVQADGTERFCYEFCDIDPDTLEPKPVMYVWRPLIVKPDSRGGYRCDWIEKSWIQGRWNRHHVRALRVRQYRVQPKMTPPAMVRGVAIQG